MVFNGGGGLEMSSKGQGIELELGGEVNGGKGQERGWRREI